MRGAPSRFTGALSDEKHVSPTAAATSAPKPPTATASCTTNRRPVRSTEAQTAALLAKGIAGDARAVDAFTAIEMLTLNGATALGMQDRIGSIEPGKQADLCAVDLSAPETQPLHHVASQLIYAASSRQVSDVWIAGRRLLDSGRLTTIDLDEVLHRTRQWQGKLARQPDRWDANRQESKP